MMVAIIVVAAFVIMAVAALAGSGKFGQWQEPVNDRPKGHLPEGPVNHEFLEQVRIPTAMFGYRRQEVDEFLAGIASGALPGDEPKFPVERAGYDMQFVDVILNRAKVATPIPAVPVVPIGEEGRLTPSTTE